MIYRIGILFFLLASCSGKKPIASLENIEKDSYVLAEKTGFSLKFSALMVDNAMPSMETTSKVYMILAIEETSGRNVQNAFAITGATIVDQSKEYKFSQLENKDFGLESPRLEAVIRGLDQTPRPQSVTISVMDIASGQEFHIKSDKINFVVAY